MSEMKSIILKNGVLMKEAANKTRLGMQSGSKNLRTLSRAVCFTVGGGLCDCNVKSFLCGLFALRRV